MSKQHQHRGRDSGKRADFLKELYLATKRYISIFDSWAKQKVKNPDSLAKYVEDVHACTEKILSVREKTKQEDDLHYAQEKPTGNDSKTENLDEPETESSNTSSSLDKSESHQDSSHSASERNASPKRSDDARKQSEKGRLQLLPGEKEQTRQTNLHVESNDDSKNSGNQTDNSQAKNGKPNDVQCCRETSNNNTNLDDGHSSAKQLCQADHDTSEIQKGENAMAMQTKLEQREEELKELHKLNENLQSQMKELECENDQMKNTNNAKQKENEELQNREASYKNKCEILTRDQTEKSKKISLLEEENGDLLSRLSKSASDKIERNNTDVADLGDPFRATVIADKFSQLYETPWTTAFRAQRKLHSDDKRAIQDLLNKLMESFRYCEETAQKQMDALSNIFKCPVQTMKEVKQRNPGKIEGKQLWSLLKLRKQLAVGTVNEISEGYLHYIKNKDRAKEKQESDIKESTYAQSDKKGEKTDSTKKPVCAGTKKTTSETGKHRKEAVIADAKKAEDNQKAEKAMKAYIEKCAEVSWMMVLHNPPLCFETTVKPGDKVDLDVFTLRSDGDSVDMLVWPVLRLGHSGDLLSKGVVEGRRSLSKPSVSENTTQDVHKNQ